MFLGSCVAGFLVNIAGSLLTKRTSAMTLKTMTMARNAALVLFSVRRVSLSASRIWDIALFRMCLGLLEDAG